MAATLADQDYLAGRLDFLARIRAAMISTALAVGAEDDDGTSYRQLRRGLSVNVLTNPDEYAAQFSIATAVNPVITIDSADGDIQFTVNSVWDAIAGAGPTTATTTASSTSGITTS